MGSKDGSIIATIITTHMPRNDAAAAGHVCPGIRIHAIDIVQPPGIGIPPIADIDVHQAIVTAVLAAKSNVETPRNSRWESRSEAIPRESSATAVAATTPSSAANTRRGGATLHHFIRRMAAGLLHRHASKCERSRGVAIGESVHHRRVSAELRSSALRSTD
jgi:hypothetical protein